jgi:hypothetical protein
MNAAASFATGALAFAAAQGLWSLAHAHGLVRGTWMMKTGGGIAACFALFVIVAAVACAFRRRGRGLGDAIATLVAGAAVAATLALFIVGPGSVWPLVILLDSVIIAMAVGVGAALSIPLRAATGRSEAS